MPVELRTVSQQENPNFHAPTAAHAYAQPFGRIGIPAVAAAAAQVKPQAFSQALDVVAPQRDRLPILAELAVD